QLPAIAFTYSCTARTRARFTLRYAASVRRSRRTSVSSRERTVRKATTSISASRAVGATTKPLRIQTSANPSIRSPIAKHAVSISAPRLHLQLLAPCAGWPSPDELQLAIPVASDSDEERNTRPRWHFQVVQRT